MDEDGTVSLASYKVRVDEIEDVYAVTKYRVNSQKTSSYLKTYLVSTIGTDDTIIADSDLIYNKLLKDMYLVDEDEYIIMAKNVSDNLSINYNPYEFVYEGETYDVVKGVNKSGYDGGVTMFDTFSNNEYTLSGIIWNDLNYDGLMNDNEYFANIGITLEQYKLVDGKFVLVNNKFATTTTDTNGNWKFTNPITFIRDEDGTISLAAYKVRVDEILDGYTVTRYRVESTVYANNDLLYTANLKDMYLVADGSGDLEDEYIIMARESDSEALTVELASTYSKAKASSASDVKVYSNPYDFMYKDVIYNVVKANPMDGYDGGLVQYMTGSINGTIWDDKDYNGLQDSGELGIANVEITLNKYYLSGNEWILMDEVQTTLTDNNGYYVFDELPTHYRNNDVNYLVGYTTKVSKMDEAYGVTKFYANGGTNDSALVASTKEINKVDLEYNDYIVLAKEYDNTLKLNDHEIIDKFDIVEALDITNYDGGLVKISTDGSIAGTIWNDTNKNGLMDEDNGIANIPIILEQYKLVNGSFVLVNDAYASTTTDSNGDYLFENLPTLLVENGENIPTSYKVRIGDASAISAYKVTTYMANGSYRNSKLKDLYLCDDYIIIAGISTNENEFYEFTYGGNTYDILLSVAATNYDGGLYKESIINKVQTGDAAPIAGYAAIFTTSLVGLLFFRRKRKFK
jgi:hypothetical protein